MLKIKLFLINAAVITGIFGAFASKPKDFCETQTQYYKSGNSYLPAGDFGIDYTCSGTAGNCTYYLSNPYDPNSYVPCRTGAFSWAFKK